MIIAQFSIGYGYITLRSKGKDHVLSFDLKVGEGSEEVWNKLGGAEIIREYNYRRKSNLKLQEKELWTSKY